MLDNIFDPSTRGDWVFPAGNRPYRDVPRLELHDKITAALTDMSTLTHNIKTMPQVLTVDRDRAYLNALTASNEANKMYHELLVRFEVEGLDPHDSSGR